MKISSFIRTSVSIVSNNPQGIQTQNKKMRCMCDRASYMETTRGTNLMQQLWFIIINSCTCRIQTHTQCTRLHTGFVGPQPQHLVLNTTCSSKQPVYIKNSWRWTYRCPKHVEAIMRINHNCCIELVRLVIFVISNFGAIECKSVIF